MNVLVILKKEHQHLKAGANKVIISAPTPDSDIKTIVMGVNDDLIDGMSKYFPMLHALPIAQLHDSIDK